MKEILETVIRSLVSEQEQVSINEVNGEKSIVLEVKVVESEMGKIIGKDGRIAKAIRTLMKAIASKEGKRVTIEFIG